MTQESQVKKYEVKILKQLEYLPKVFMIKHLNGEVTKISILLKHFENCTNYISRSKLTFSGCFKYADENLSEVRGIYYTPTEPIMSVHKTSKITRSLDDMKNIILQEIELLNLKSKELLISYDNYSIAFYDYYIKGQLYQFDLVYNQGYLEIYEVPPIHSDLNLAFDDANGIGLYHHEIKFSSPTLVRNLYSDPGVTYLVHPQNDVTLTMKSPTSSDGSVTLKANRYYLITHPRPRT